MTTFITSCFIALLGLAGSTTSDDPLITRHTVEADGRLYPYAVFRSPHLADDADAPMVVFLHGSGECGTDGLKQLAVGLLPAVLLDSQRWPAVIVFPQKPSSDSAWIDHEAAVLEMIDRTASDHGVDRDRIALTGLSQGGNGSFAFGSRHPGLFCAVAPICGYVGWNEKAPGEPRWPPNWITVTDDQRVLEIVDGLGDLPVWAIHGEADRAVPIAQSLLVMDRLAHREDDALTTMTRLPGVGHNAWDHAYRATGLAEWLLADRSAD